VRARSRGGGDRRAKRIVDSAKPRSRRHTLIVAAPRSLPLTPRSVPRWLATTAKMSTTRTLSPNTRPTFVSAYLPYVGEVDEGTSNPDSQSSG
jgi:hypothetical protein